MSANELLNKANSPRGGDGGKEGLFRGFSLIELMLVIAIISILVAVAFISMLHYELVIRVNASARDLGGHMRMVRAQAIRDGRSHLFVFSPGGYTYGIDGDENDTFDGPSKSNGLQPGIAFGYMQNTVQVPGHLYPVSCGVYIGTACGTMFHFKRDGTATFDGVAYLIPAKDQAGTGARDDRQRAVDWYASSGRIRVWKYFASLHEWR